MVAYESGTPSGRRHFDGWRRSTGATRSFGISSWLGNFDSDNAPSTHVDAGVAAKRRLLTSTGGRAMPFIQLETLGAIALDSDAPRRVRERAFQGLTGYDTALGAKVAICRERELYGEDCSDLVEQLGRLDEANPEYGAGLDALDGAANVRAAWFSPVPWLAGEQLSGVHGQLARYAGTRVSATTDYQTAAVFAELAANRPDLAQARLAAYGDILRPETRLVADMALRDLAEGLVEPRNVGDLLLELPSADIEASWFLDPWFPGEPADVGELFPGPSRLARFARGLALGRMGAWDLASAELSLLHLDLQGRDAGLVAGRLALAAELAGDAPMRDRALASAETHDPHGFMVPFVRARIAEAAGHGDLAHGMYLDGLLRRPRSVAAFEGALRTLPEDRRELESVRAALLGFPDRPVHWWASELLSASHDPGPGVAPLDGDAFRQLWLARDDGDAALEIGAPAALYRPTAEVGLARLLEALQAQPLPEGAFPIAAKVLAWLDAMPPQQRVEHRDLELWLTFLIRPDSELESLAAAAPRIAGRAHTADPTHGALLLAQARREGAVDDLRAWSLIRAEVWDIHDSLTERYTSALFAPIENQALAQFACLHMFQRDELEIAAERCIPLWNALDGTPFLAVDLAYLALNRADLAQANDLDLDAFFARAGELPDLARDPVWLLNASLWASKRGDDQLGADLRVRQLAIQPIGEGPDDLELGQGRYRGPLLRRQLIDQFGHEDRRGWALAAGSALRSVDLVAAALYAEHLLAWLPDAVLDEVPALTAQAPAVLAATRPEGETSDAELRSLGLYALAMTALVGDDIHNGRIDRPTMVELMDAYGRPGAAHDFAGALAANPESHVAMLLALEGYREARMREEALAVARRLIALHPFEPLVLVEALPLLTGSEDLLGARRLLAEARERNPGHPWLSDEALPSILTGAVDRTPVWMRSPEAFGDQLDALSDAALDALEPTRLVSLEVSAEAFFAAAAEPTGDGKLGTRQEIPNFSAPTGDPEAGSAGSETDEQLQSRVQFIVSEPRASRCEGMDCAESLIAEWTGRNYALLWTREIELPAGSGVEFLVADGESMIDNVIVPSGGNVFVLISGSTPDDFEAFLPQLALLRQSFRPLDFSVSANTAESLRVAGSRQPSDDLRWRGRRVMAGSAQAARARAPGPVRVQGGACLLSADPSFAPQWRDLPSADRGELLLDLLLTTHSARARAGLLACTAPAAPEAARVALLSLLDPHAAIYEFGREATLHHSQRVLDDTRRVLYQTREPATSNPALTTSAARPEFGLLQVIAALPLDDARTLTREMLSRRNEPRLRALALAASATMDFFGDARDGRVPAGRTDPAALREVVREGSPSDASIAVRSIMDRPEPEDLAALRARADTLIASGAHTRLERALARSLAWALARNLEARDRRRIDKLAKAIDLDPEDGEPKRAAMVRDLLLEIAEDLEEGRRLLSGKPALTDEGPQRWVRRLQARGAPRSRDQLATEDLADLVPGDQWTFVRVGNAGLFATSLESLVRRMAPANPADAYLVRTIVHDMLLQGGFTLLAEGGGLDLSQPIECASPKGSESFVCSATVRDRTSLLANLAQRERGDDAGVAIPLSIVTELASLPLSMGILPLLLHSVIEAAEEELGPDPAPELAAERLRTTRVIAGHELEYYATVQILEGRVTVDSEHYLILDDRLLVFSGADMAQRVLRTFPGATQSLGEQPEYLAALEKWHDGVALQAVDFTEDLGLRSVALELVIDNDGLAFTATAATDDLGDLGGLEALLPPDPTSSVALALDEDGLGDHFDDLELERCASHGLLPKAPKKSKKLEPGADPRACGLTKDDHLPPLVVAQAAQSVILGWYPQDGDSLWQRWVLVLPLDAEVRAATRKAGVSLAAPGEIEQSADLYWLVRDGALVVSSDPQLVATVQAMPVLAPNPRPSFTHGKLDGQGAAAAMRTLASRYDGERRADYLRLLATLVGLVESVDFEGHWGETGPGNIGQLSAKIRLNLAESEEELALIDRWLASPEIGNASRLPRHLGRAETQRGLTYRITVADAQHFAHSSVPDDNPRMRVEVLGSDEILLHVLPSSAVSSAKKQPLDSAERERSLKSDNYVRATDPDIVAIADQLRVPGDDRATVAAVVAWVHAKIDYEITPTRLDATTILDRAQGDCTEYALLTVTILRAAGIPAKLKEGMAAGGDEMVAHAWVAWHDGTRWREVDPTAGNDSVGSGHLELEVVDVLAMISLGRFEITELNPMH